MSLDRSITLPSGQVTDCTRLNLGCGFDIREGYLNVDLNDFHSPDIVANIIDMEGFPSNSFDEIYAKDVLEHFLWRDTPKALTEWNRLLKLGGRLFVATTYLTGVARRVLDPSFADLEFQRLTIINLFSMQKYEGDFHLTIFTERLFRWHMWMAGFEIEEIKIVDGWLIHAWAVKSIDRSGEEYLTAQTDIEFVETLYTELLGREPDQAGLDAKLKGLLSGLLTRPGIYKDVLLCEERLDHMARVAPDFPLQFDPY